MVKPSDHIPGRIILINWVQVISYGQKLSKDVTRLVEQMHAVPDSLINFY